MADCFVEFFSSLNLVLRRRECVTAEAAEIVEEGIASIKKILFRNNKQTNKRLKSCP